MMRGTRLHKMAEDYINGVIASIPYDLTKIAKILNHIKTKEGAKAEEIWMLKADWTPTEDKEEAKLKAIIDVHYVKDGIVYLKDYKSGGMYDNHRDQLELYGLMALCKYPEAKLVDMSAVYIDTGYEGMQGTIIRPMVLKLKNKWGDKVVAIEKDNDFEPKPGPQCRGCPYSKDKGGQCMY